MNDGTPGTRDLIVDGEAQARWFPWADPVRRCAALVDGFAGGTSGAVDLVWAAGTAGFGADEGEVIAELDAFRDVTAVLAEHAVGRGVTSVAVHIRRPSSVYTDPRPGRRPGLIGALLANGLKRSPTPIIGALDTLRDHVHAQDVGRHIGHRVVDGGRTPGVSVEFLVKGNRLRSTA